MKLKSLIFFLRTRSRSISGDRDVIFSCHWAFSSLAQHPDCLPAGDPGLTARLAREQLLLPRRVYLRLAMRIAIIYPSPTPPKKKRNRQQGKRGKDAKGEIDSFLIHAAWETLGPPRLTSISRNELKKFCVMYRPFRGLFLFISRMNCLLQHAQVIRCIMLV